MSKHQLPELPYAFDSLEPFIDAQTMEIHHDKHHAAYVNKLNAALDKYPKLLDVSIEELLVNLNSVPEEVRNAVHNHGGGHANHSLFWPLLGKDKGGAPKGDLAGAIDQAVGSFDGFKDAFGQVAATHFGSGWAWLSVGRFGNLMIHSTPNRHSPLMQGLVPVIGLDLWEHAYYLKYQNRRPEYIEAFWSVIDWDQAEANFQAALVKIRAEEEPQAA